MILVYFFGRGLIAILQWLPLPVVARIGRAGGALFWPLDARHRRVTLENLRACFKDEKTEAEIVALGKEHFRRLGESYCCAIKVAGMTTEQLRPHVEYHLDEVQPPRRVIMAYGHFGNFELYARFQDFFPGYQCACTYRALKQPQVNALMQYVREQSRCLFFERRTDGRLIREAMRRPNIMMGFAADQSSRGMRGPFLGRECDTNLSPAVFALRYECELFTVFCYRVALAKWRVELGDKIATHQNGAPRSSQEIMRDVNLSFEKAVRRDPANWFWVHRRWKLQPGPSRSSTQQNPEGQQASSSVPLD